MSASVVYTNVLGQVLMESRGGVDTEFIPDPLGNVVKCKTSSVGFSYFAEYWPYGEIQTSTDSNPSNFGYVGTWGYYQDSPNQTYVRARYYKPVQARWMTIDPLWPWEKAYGYVDGMPISRIDPSGMQQLINPGDLIIDPIWLPRPRIDLENALSCGCKKNVRPCLDESKAFGFSKGHDMTNALGHCITACCIKRRFPECVWYWNAREIGGVVIRDDASCMDDWNNKVGYGCAGGSATCYACCLSNLNKLTWYEPKRHNWPPKGGACTGKGGSEIGGVGPGLSGGNLVRIGPSPIWD